MGETKQGSSGFKKIDVKFSMDIKIELIEEAVTSGGMGWKVDYWGNAHLFGTEGMFIALE